MTDAAPTYSDPQQFERAWAQLVSRSWSDPQFREQLLADPTQALAEQGVNVPASMILRAEDGASTVTVLLPLPPAPPHVAENRLDAGADDLGVVASSCCSTC